MMRKKRRYIAFEAERSARLFEVMRTVDSMRPEERNEARPFMRLMLYDERTRRGLVRCGHRQVEEVKSRMSSSGGHVNLRPIGVSGTIKAAKRKFLADVG